MEERKFYTGNVLKTGWTKFKEQPWTWVGALLLMGLILMTQPLLTYLVTGDFGGVLSEAVVDEGRIDDGGEEIRTPDEARNGEVVVIYQNPWEGLISFIYTLIQSGLSLGLTYMGIRAVDGQTLQLSDLFARFRYFFYNFIGQILYSLIVLAGLILLIVPGIIWGLRYSLYPYFIADKKVGPIQALKMSAEATQGAKWDLFKFMLAAILIGLAGILALVVGIFVAMPVITIATAAIYRILSNRLIQSEAAVPLNATQVSHGKGV